MKPDREATVFITFERGRYSSEMKVTNIRQKKPKIINQPTVQVTLRLPDAVFEPFAVVKVEVPEGAIIAPSAEPIITIEEAT